MAALVLSVVGLCFPPLVLVAAALGLYGVLRARTDEAWRARQQLSQGALLVSGAGLIVFAVLVVPNFQRVMVRTRQTECREQLYALYAAQTRLHASNQRYTTQLSELDVPFKAGRYVYRLAASGPLWTGGPVGPEHTGIGLGTPHRAGDTSETLEAGVPTLLRETLGVSGSCPGCSVTLLCVGNLDDDDTVDVWSISSAERADAAGEKIAPGLLWNHVDDTAR